jgi:cyclic pyranopterin monophosphate synthase
VTAPGPRPPSASEGFRPGAARPTRRAGLTHVGRRGARMVDVGAKAETVREAVARGEVVMRAATLRLITRGAARKGDVLTVAQIAGIAAAKRTWELIPLCHPIPLTGVDVTLEADSGSVPGDAARGRVAIEARVRTRGRTGAEMEALAAVAVAALTVYDMVKAVERGVSIERIRLVRKSGGKSGAYEWNGAAGRPS